MNPLAALRNLQNQTPTQTNSNPGQGASSLGVSNNYFNFFTADQTYNGESFSAGDILIGNNTASNDNFVYKNGVFRIRYGTSNIITLHNLGMRLVDGGISLAPVASATTFNGAHELNQNGAEMTTSRLRLTTATGAFTLNSIVAPLNQNLMLILSNETVQNMTLTNDYATPTSGYWAIHTYTGADVTTSGNGMAFLVGNAAQSRWDLISAVSVGVVASSSGNYVTIGNDAALSAERALTGTANQITVTDNGANSTVVLSTPQNIHTAATPTFQSLTLSHTAPQLNLTDTTGSAKSLQVIVDGNKATFEELGGTDMLVMDLANARVGIGTASPTSGYKLETSESVLVNSSTNNSGFVARFTGSSSASVGPQNSFTTNDGAAVVNQDRIGTFLFNGYDGTAEVLSAAIIARATETWATTTNRGSQIDFLATPNGSVTQSTPLVVAATTLTLADAVNVAVNTTTGTKIGTGTTQKLGFWNATPIVQPTTAYGAASFTAGAGTAVNDASTFDGYTLKQIVAALRGMGILA